MYQITIECIVQCMTQKPFMKKKNGKNFHVFIQTTEKYMFMNMLQVNEHFVSFFYNTFCVHGTIFLEMLNMNNCVNSIE